MIQFGTVTRSLGKAWGNIKHEVTTGYYLVCKDRNGDECRYWLSSDANADSLHKACSEHLGEWNNYDYWVDRCFGLDVSGRLAWANMDQTDRFI